MPEPRRLPQVNNMAKSAAGRAVFRAVAASAVIAAVCAAVEHFTQQRHLCERCGGSMRPFRYGDWDWAGSGIYECPACGFMVDQPAFDFAQRQWGTDLTSVDLPIRPSSR